MGGTEELSDFQRGNVIGCHLCKKSVREIAAMLELPRSTVSDVILKWKRLGVTTPLPRSGQPRKLSNTAAQKPKVIKRNAKPVMSEPSKEQTESKTEENSHSNSDGTSSTGEPEFGHRDTQVYEPVNRTTDEQTLSEPAVQTMDQGD